MTATVAEQVVPALPSGTPGYVYVILAISGLLVSALGVVAARMHPPDDAKSTDKSAVGSTSTQSVAQAPTAVSVVDETRQLFRETIDELRRELTQAREELRELRSERDRLLIQSSQLESKLHQTEEHLDRALNDLTTLRAQLDMIYRPPGPGHYPPYPPRDWHDRP